MSSPVVARKDYEDFVLRIRKDSAGYVVSPSCPAGVGPGPGEPFPSPFQEGDLDELRAFREPRFRDLDSAKESARSRASDLGQRLFEAVFSGKGRSFWAESLVRIRHDERRLRLRLIVESPELWDWPWEYLRDPESDFLILSPDISIVRCPEVRREMTARPIALPLRVVVVIAQPRGSAPLDSNGEWRALEKALAVLVKSGRVELRRIDSASLAALRKELAQPVHVLHFIGHGGFDRNREEAFLSFETLKGEPDPVTGMDLARILRLQAPPALVVLNACEGGRAIKDDPFAGVAQALVREGMPAVVAMQFKISDQSALVFSKEFYEALAQSDSVDQAVFEARHALVSERSVDWGNPVLYLRRGSTTELFPDGPAPMGRRFMAGVGALLLVALSTGGYFLSNRRPNPMGPSDLDVTPFVGPPRKSIGSSAGCPPIPELDIIFKRIEHGTFIMGARGEG